LRFASGRAKYVSPPLSKPRAVARVKPGRYTIESMKEFDGETIVTA